MQYMITIANDLSKLISHIKGQNVAIKPNFEKQCSSIADFCLEYFTRLVVNEQGPVQTDSIKFLKECLLELITLEEKQTFICRIIDEFLSVPLSHISQKAVIEALVQVGFCDKVLITYLVEKLDIDSNKKLEASPITMMFSVLSLALHNYRQLKPIPVATEPSSEQGMNYNKQYRHLFYTTLWICRNEQNLFSKQEQIALLNYLT